MQWRQHLHARAAAQPRQNLSPLQLLAAWAARPISAAWRLLLQHDIYCQPSEVCATLQGSEEWPRCSSPVAAVRLQQSHCSPVAAVPLQRPRCSGPVAAPLQHPIAALLQQPCCSSSCSSPLQPRRGGPVAAAPLQPRCSGPVVAPLLAAAPLQRPRCGSVAAAPLQQPRCSPLACSRPVAAPLQQASRRSPVAAAPCSSLVAAQVATLYM